MQIGTTCIAFFYIVFMNDVFVIVNLILLESILSIDNAAGLAVIVQRLPHEQRGKALRYGLFGAYFFRFVCLVFVGYIIKITALKIIGGLYLTYLSCRHFFSDSRNNQKEIQFHVPLLSQFWQTVLIVETADLIFSIDNVFAAVALTENLVLVMVGVGIGILAMRFVAGMFVRLIERYPTLQTSAFFVILLLGIKLILSGIAGYCSDATELQHILDSHAFDMGYSIVMLAVFCFPFLRRTSHLRPKLTAKTAA